MKAISLWQPWSSLLVHGKKRCETRHWSTSYRGPLLIHAAKKWDADLAALSRTEPFASVLRSLGLSAATLPFGAIVGRVEVVDCIPTENTDAAAPGSSPDMPPMPIFLGVVNRRILRLGSNERAFGDYSLGRFAWLCVNPVAFPTPIPFRGAQGFFDVPDDLIRKAVPA